MSLRKKLLSQTSSWANWNMKQKKSKAKQTKKRTIRGLVPQILRKKIEFVRRFSFTATKRERNIKAEVQLWYIFFFLIYTMLRFFSHNKGISNAISVLNKIFKPSSPPFSFAFAVTGKCFSSRREKYFLFVLFIFPLPGLHIFSLQPSAVN